MKTFAGLSSLRTLRSRRTAGHTLLLALITATLLTGLVGVAIQRSTSAARIGARATSYANAARAVDGVLEYAYGMWKSGTVQKDGPLSKTVPADNTILTGAGPIITGIAYSTPLNIQPVDAYGTPATTSVPVLVYLSDYPGWRGNAYNYIASVSVQPSVGPNSNRPSPTGGRRLFQYIEVPLFQAMYFFEHTLEIYRPAPMIVGGPVHSNDRLLVSGSSDSAGVEIEFKGQLSYADTSGINPGYSFSEPPIGGPAWAGFSVANAPGNMEPPTFSGGGADQQINKVERFEPIGKQPAAVLNASDSNPNNDTFHEIIEPPNTSFSDPPEISKRRLYNKAGIILTVTGTTATVTAQNGTSLTSTQITNLKAAFTGKTTIYDAREGKNVDVANVNMSSVTSVLNGAASFNGLLYIQDTTTVNTSDPEPKTVRLTNGGVLPNNGLTVASQNPVYVQGDYNTGTTTSSTAVPANASGNQDNSASPTVSGYTRKPAAVIADAVMLLSNNWSDSKASSSVGSRVASNTTYNMAILAGFMPSGYDPDGTGPKAPYGYSGGANNFPRFLETWTNKTCTYYGSMVELFQSTTFTGKWDTGSIYAPPLRRWNFDTNFSTTPPPGSLDAVAIVRGGWMRF